MTDSGEIEGLLAAVRNTLRFYDNLGRVHDEGEPEILDALQQAADRVKANPTAAQPGMGERSE